MEMEDEVFARAWEFLANKWLEKQGIQGYVAKAVRANDKTTPSDETAL